MRPENEYLRILSMVLRAVAVIVLVLALIRASRWAYGFGYSIFAQKPVSSGEGYVVTVTITESDSVNDIGTILKEKGLIKDKLLFRVQEKLSEYHGKIVPGTYDLSTSMTVNQMLEIMAKDSKEVAEETK